MPTTPPRKQIRLALIDDHDAFRTGMCRLLQARGFAASGFACVADFIKAGAVTRIDCLVLDVGMPDIDGFALHECLCHTNYEFPVIFCTGRDRDEKITRAEQRGAVYFLQKPVTIEALAETINVACAAVIPIGNSPSAKGTVGLPGPG